jgi:hypothetical protein
MHNYWSTNDLRVWVFLMDMLRTYLDWWIWRITNCMEWSVWLLRVYTNTHSTSLLGFIVIGMVVKLASWLIKSYDFTSQHRYTMWNQVKNSKSSKLGQNRLNSGNSGTEFTEFDKINKNYWPTLLSPLLSISFVSQKLSFPLSLFPKSHILWF